MYIVLKMLSWPAGGMTAGAQEGKECIVRATAFYNSKGTIHVEYMGKVPSEVNQGGSPEYSPSFMMVPSGVNTYPGKTLSAMK